MTRRTQRIAANIAETIREANASTESVAQAADLSQHEFEQLLDGAAPIPVRVLEKVGGFLRVPAHHFLRGVA